jgi:hypothetical protein
VQGTPRNWQIQQRHVSKLKQSWRSVRTEAGGGRVKGNYFYDQVRAVNLIRAVRSVVPEPLPAKGAVRSQPPLCRIESNVSTAAPCLHPVNNRTRKK